MLILFSQGHLLELKLAALKTLAYEGFFQLFGKGRTEDFCDLLDNKLSPYLSSPCYQFWDCNRSLFDSSSSFYNSGYSGRAILLLRWLFFITRRSGDIQLLCSADSIEEQKRIWNDRIRPILLNPLVVFILKHPVFCWNALGVPANQRRMILKESTIYNYVKDTLDPIPSHGLLKDGAYHYLLVSFCCVDSRLYLCEEKQTLLGEYTESSCPMYLTREGFKTLTANNFERLRSLLIHTDTIIKYVYFLLSWVLHTESAKVF